MMSPTLDEQERHYLVKLMDRVIFRLKADVAPFAHKILVVASPLLIDANFFAR
jgi:splicing factor 3B subunit 1